MLFSVRQTYGKRVCICRRCSAMQTACHLFAGNAKYWKSVTSILDWMN